MTLRSVDDTVTAQIVPVDLFAIVKACKEAQFREYGKPEGCTFEQYEKALASLREGKPQKRLQSDRLAREVVRAILRADQPVAFEGRDAEFPTYGAVFFDSHSDKEVANVVYGLMNDDGLLDFTFYSCASPNLFCLQTEMIHWQEELRVVGTDRVEHTNYQKYEENRRLKGAIADMLKPFQAEKPICSVRREGYTIMIIQQ